MDIRILYHPTCATSHKVIKALMENNLLDRVALESIETPQPSITRGVWSVPWILVDGDPVATDPVEPEEVVALVGEGKPLEPRGDAYTMLAEAILHSAFASAHVITASSLTPVLTESFTRAALRSKYTGYTLNALDKARLEELYDEWRGKFARALAFSFVRELWWASKGGIEAETLKVIPLEAFAAWVIGKASVGRIGIPVKPHPDMEALEEGYRMIVKGAGRLIARIELEQETILADEEYLSLSSRR